MIIISHRGNINGPDRENENKKDFILNSISHGFDCEIDLWFKDNKFFLGHDLPQYEVDIDWLSNLKNKLWIHCKNLDVMNRLKKTDFNYFWHDIDLCTITSKGYYWSQPGIYLDGGISVETDFKKLESSVFGVCTDYPKKFKEFYV